MSDKNGHILGITRQRSKQNREDLDRVADMQEELRARLDSVENYAKAHALFLGLLAAQALGIPTDKLLSLILSAL